MRRKVSETLRAFFKRALRAPRLSPTGLAARAVVLALVYFALHLAGLREYASFLSGTAPTGDPKDVFALGLGVTYVLLHIGFVLLVPVLLIAAGVLYGLQRALLRTRPDAGGGTTPAKQDTPVSDETSPGADDTDCDSPEGGAGDARLSP